MMKMMLFCFFLAVQGTVIFEPYTDASCTQKRFTAQSYSERYYIPLLDRPVGYDNSLAAELNGGVYPREPLGTWTKVSTTEVEFTSDSGTVVPFDPTDSNACVNTGFWSYGKWKIVNGPGVLELFRSDNTLEKDLAECQSPSKSQGWHGTFRYPIAPNNFTCTAAGQVYIYWDGSANDSIMYCLAQVEYTGGYASTCSLQAPGRSECLNSDPSNQIVESTCKCVTNTDCNTDYGSDGRPSYYPFAETRVSTIKIVYGNRVSATTSSLAASDRFVQTTAIAVFAIFVFLLI